MRKLVILTVLLSIGNLARADENFNLEKIEYIESCRKLMLHPEKINPYFFGGVSMSVRIVCCVAPIYESYTIYIIVDNIGEETIVVRRRVVDNTGEVKIKEISLNPDNKLAHKISLDEIAALQPTPIINKDQSVGDDVEKYMILVESPFKLSAKRIFRSQDERYILEPCVRDTLKALETIFLQDKGNR